MPPWKGVPWFLDHSLFFSMPGSLAAFFSREGGQLFGLRRALSFWGASAFVLWLFFLK